MAEIDDKIGRWLEKNTFHHSEFWDMQELVRAKEAAGLTISLCIPTLNEEQTIGKEVIVFKSELMDRYPFIDEIAVIDSGSTDRTLEIAASYGADTYRSAEILPKHGFRPGKGENLWKAIYQLKGDIICYVDADIKNIHPKFVTGLVAPLIYRPEIQYVKAFYDRPLSSLDSLKPTGGGRVTEILVRPLFSLFFPELTALIQPISGEYAVRRKVLEELCFPVGYGVETSHLIDVFQTWGLDAFAQTDLDKRVHRNQSTTDLGRMAFGILQTFLKRLRAYGIVKDMPELSGLFRQFQTDHRSYELTVREMIEEERPPMISLPEYRKRHGR
jgi:glucosyl-3-phosphoglycerate synthase